MFVIFCTILLNFIVFNVCVFSQDLGLSQLKDTHVGDSLDQLANNTSAQGMIYSSACSY